MLSNGQERANHAVRLRCARACETCKRRKERCDGLQPCGRCHSRGVSPQCRFVQRRKLTRIAPRVGSFSRAEASIEPRQTERNEEVNGDNLVSQTYAISPSASSHTNSLDQARLIRDQKGRFMFIGDSANLSFLQGIRRVVGDALGLCPFVDDPLRYLMVEASPGQSHWLDADTQRVSHEIGLKEAQTLVKRYIFATNCVLDLFDEDYLLGQLPSWVNGSAGDLEIPGAMIYLVLAIGAQTAPDNQDELADTLFNHGRYLTNRMFMEDASILTVQAYALITMYMLGASRRNTAFMNLGIAVRAAYAIGLHRKEVSTSCSPAEFLTRERLWKVLRILDLFMSASLGRPPSTAETRDTEAGEEYSASNDLCHIFEKILTDVYSRRMVSTDALSAIGAHHRRWASRFSEGLATDKIDPRDVLEENSLPNIGLLHIKEAYYWTIILVTRPFLSESITQHTKSYGSGAIAAPEPCTASDSNKVLVHACVDSAMRTIELLKRLQDCKGIPKRLPFIINSLFNASLVLGLAYFGDLYQLFPLGRYLDTAHKLLAQFTDDAISQRNASIVGYLRDACTMYMYRRSMQSLDYQGRVVGSMFGQIHRSKSRAVTRGNTPMPACQDAANPQQSSQDGSSSANPDSANPAVNPLQTAAAESLCSLYELNVDNWVDMPFPIMSPRTLWFDSLDGNTPLFSTISTTTCNFTNS